MDTVEIPSIDRPVNSVVSIPGSKSITNRALLIAALASGESVLENALFSEDTHWCSTCLSTLGIPVQRDETQARIRVTGLGGRIPSHSAELFVGNSGTTARFITALLSLAEGTFSMDGIPRMRERPMDDQLEVLERLGTGIGYQGEQGHIPYTMRTNGFVGGHILIEARKTSQQVSALLMVAPYAHEDTVIEIVGEAVSQSYIDMTLRVMSEFGVEVERADEGRYSIRSRQTYQPLHYTVEPDASNATYFFAAAAATGGRVTIERLTRDSVQGDIRFLDVLEAMGCRVSATDSSIEVQGPEALRGIEVDMQDMSDTVPTLAAIAPLASSPVTIRNVEFIRRKETDRISAVVNELRRLRIEVDEFSDGMTIYPGAPAPAEVETYNDHRMAMAFAVLGLRVPGIRIKDPDCTQKTFPDFFERFFGMLEEPQTV